MANLDGSFDRLIKFQEANITSLNTKISTFTKYREDYESLKKLLHNITDRVSFPHRIPIAGSQLALAEGRIVHTNEILVLLGDETFALRSAKQASEIVERRLKRVDGMIEENKAAKKKVEDWLDATQQLRTEKEEFVEIIETC